MLATLIKMKVHLPFDFVTARRFCCLLYNMFKIPKNNVLDVLALESNLNILQILPLCSCNGCQARSIRLSLVLYRKIFPTLMFEF